MGEPSLSAFRFRKKETNQSFCLHNKFGILHLIGAVILIFHIYVVLLLQIYITPHTLNSEINLIGQTLYSNSYEKHEKTDARIGCSLFGDQPYECR